jgi:hypothetical protein
MRTRQAAKTTPMLVRLGQKILSYIDLLVRTVCIILGLVVSGWVKFIDEIAPPPAPAPVSSAAPAWSPSRPLLPLPGMSESAASPTFTGQGLYR